MNSIFSGLLIFSVAAVALGAQTLKLPAGVAIVSQKASPEAVVYDLSWPAPHPDWSEGKAWLVVPAKAAKAPAVFYFHMYGSRRDRNEFLPEATENAKAGIAGILIQGAVPWWDSWAGDAKDPQRLRDQISQMRFTLKILQGQDWIDPQRIAFVGHDYGAMFGAMLADDPAFCAMALVAPSARFSDWIFYFNTKTAADKPAYDALFGDDQPITRLGQAHRVPVLLQFAENDRFISPAQAAEFGDAVAKTATVQLIPKASHEGISKSGKDQRWEFLNRYLSR